MPSFVIDAVIACFVIGMCAPTFTRTVNVKIIYCGLGLSAVFAALTLLAGFAHHLDECALFGVAAEATVMLCVWLEHCGPNEEDIDDDDDDDDIDDDDPDGDGGGFVLNWDEFDRLRAHWSEPRDREHVPL
jgi:hypothetical protein